MKNLIIETYYRLLQSVPVQKHRYLYNTFDISSRLSGLVGARGTGKTTLMLQYIREKIEDQNRALYFSADHLYFSNHSMLEFIQEQSNREGRQFFFIDEIHKYANWNQELKNVYDSFPDIHIVFSGSSSIDLIQGSYDLSRRAVLHRLYGLSFREYLNFECDLDLKPVSYEELLHNHQSIARDYMGIQKLLGHFQSYCKTGYYPFYFEDKSTFSQRLLSVLEKTIYDDISSFYNLKTENLPVLKKLVAYFSTIQPGETSINTIAKSLTIDNKTISAYIEMLTKTGILLTVGIDKSGAAMIRNPHKIFLSNTNLYNSILSELGQAGRIGTIRECFFLSMLLALGKRALYTKRGDYTVGSDLFEIGGKNKDFSQIRDVPEGFLVKDDILVGSSRFEIPLYLFGFLY